jgi:hypothetical protein
MKPAPKQHGKIIFAINSIGTVCLQLEAADVPTPIKAQAAKVKTWADACVDILKNSITDATIRRLGKYGLRFSELSRALVVRTDGPDEYGATVLARMMYGHYALGNERHALGIRGKEWRYLDQTAGTLLAMLIDGMGAYEGAAFNVAEKIYEEAA